MELSVSLSAVGEVAGRKLGVRRYVRHTGAWLSLGTTGGGPGRGQKEQGPGFGGFGVRNKAIVAILSTPFRVSV